MEYSIFTDTMADMNLKELENMSKKKVPVLFPIGVIEEHGPHLPYATDIYMSYVICKMIKERMTTKDKDCIIAPPYYWGVNHCTKMFSGTFSLSPETMIIVLTEIFGNLHQFGFDRIYCVNQHEDRLHVKTIIKAIEIANKKYHMHIALLVEPYNLGQYGLSGDEDYILLDKADYSPDVFKEDDENEQGLFDIHAGALETAAMQSYYPDAVCKETAKSLTSYSLSQNDLLVWLAGGEGVKRVVPLGYAGNPTGYDKKLTSAKSILETLASYCAKKIIEDAF